MDHGVWLAELAAVRDPAQVAAVVAAAVGISTFRISAPVNFSGAQKALVSDFLTADGR
jgi:hypothetical protein